MGKEEQSKSGTSPHPQVKRKECSVIVCKVGQVRLHCGLTARVKMVLWWTWVLLVAQRNELCFHKLLQDVARASVLVLCQNLNHSHGVRVKLNVKTVGLSGCHWSLCP